MPMRDSFRERLCPRLPQIADYFGTPFHIYDEAGIKDTANNLWQAFAAINGFREYFAVKALPNPQILKIIQATGFGFDCSSIAELALARQIGASKEDIFFTSTNTSLEDLQVASADGGCILNLDDIGLLDRLPAVPDVLSFRYNPGAIDLSNRIIGAPQEAKFGITREQVIEGYRRAIGLGVRRFGLHTMVVSNELDYRQMVQTTRLLLELAGHITTTLNISFEFINIGGGLGIPYRPEDTAFDVNAMASEIAALFASFESTYGYVPKLFMESGRYLTGPHGVLVTRVINRKQTYRTYIGVDASMSALMRPGMYGAYHHMEVLEKNNTPSETVDVVGSLCENNDKFAINRQLPCADIGDLVVIHDTGAHGHAMGFNYNGRLRPKELLLREDGTVHLIRRQETFSDYFATLNFEPQVFP